MTGNPRAVLAAALFLACVIAANWLTATFGLVPIGLGFTVPAGTFAAGLALLARDVVQDAAGRRAVVVVIVAGAALSWLVAGGRIAVASGVAFGLSELADMAVYTPLRHRGWNRAVIASNAVGGAVDSLLFLGIAGFPVTVRTIATLWLAKMAITLATLAVVGGVRAVRGHTVRAGRT
jgi:hypothetical protein